MKVLGTCAALMALPMALSAQDTVMQIALRALPSGSGVRYVGFDEQDGYRLYTKGDDAFVMHMAADHTAEEVPVLRDCSVAKQ